MYNSGQTSDGWRSMTTAPGDGTIVELKNTFGVAPWYGIYKWTDEMQSRENDWSLTAFKLQKPTWADMRQPGISISEEERLQWRPFTGIAGGYVDPTGGAQDTPLYWRRAVAISHGLSSNYFERPHGPLAWLRKLFG